MKNILIIVTLVTCFNAWSEPGGTYTLTGEEKSISEIIKADVAQYPELYQGESLDGYISKFNKRNKIGKRRLAPGDQLYFPETIASRKAKKLKLEEEKAKEKERAKQKKRLAKERIDSFTEKNETEWIPDAEFREFIDEAKRKGFLTQNYRITEVDGRCNEDGKTEYRIKYELVPNEGRYEWRWWFSIDEKFFEKQQELNKGKGLEMVHEQSYTLPNGEKRYQAVWFKHEA